MANYHTSPFGTVGDYPKINKPDTKFNADGLFKYDHVMRADDPEAVAFKARIDAAADQAMADLTKDMTPATKKKFSLYLPYHMEEDKGTGESTGNIVFEFKQNAKIKLKSGVVKDVQIGIKDAKNQDVLNVWINNGSIVRALYSFRPILMQSAQKAGVRMDFAAVQIKKLAERSSGFGAIEGDDDAYVHHADNEPASDEPHTPMGSDL